MQIKVKDTRIHKVVVQSGSAFTETKEVPVADAKLVLVECKREDSLLFKYNDHNSLYLSLSGHYDGKHYKPILISLTEKIEVGDWVLCYYPDGSNTIRQIKKDDGTIWIDDKGTGWFKTTAIYKILALPEHFSPSHLQDIVDGKLKEGKMAAECKKVRRKGNPIERDMVADVIGYAQEELLNSMDEDILHIIKLNPHLTLYKVEEKMYTREEVRVLAKRCWGYKNESIQTFEEWFEQNVT